MTELRAWGRGLYRSPVLETSNKVINLMELGNKEEQEWLVQYLKEEIRKRKQQ